VTKGAEILAVWKEIAGGAERKRQPRPSLGVSLTVGAADVSGARIERVQQNSAAAEAGLEPGDVIVQFDGKRITEWSQLIREIRRKSPGDRVALKYVKGSSGQLESATVTLKKQSRGGRGR
jgi:putative serine protease PepD